MERVGQPRTLRDLVSTLFIYKWTIILVTLAIGGGALGLSLLQPNKYEASVQVWAHDQAVEVRNASDFVAEKSARIKQVLSNLEQVITSRDVLLATLSECNQLPSDPETVNAAVSQLRKAIRLEAPEGSDFGSTQIFFVRVRHQDPGVAKQLAGTLISEFQSRYEMLAGEQATHVFEETARQLGESRRTLKALDKKLAEFLSSLHPGRLQDLQSLSSQSASESALNRKIISLNERIVPLQSELEQNKAIFIQIQQNRFSGIGALPGQFVRANPALDEANKAVVASKIKLGKLAAYLTPSNSEYQTQLDEVRQLEATYQEEISRSLSALQQETESKQHVIEFLIAERNRQAEELTGLSGRFVEYASLQKDIEQQREIVANAERRHSDSIHNKLTASSEVLFSNIDGPRSGTDPVTPRTVLNTIVGSLAGLLLGLGLAFLRQHYSQTVRTEHDLAEWDSDKVIILSVPKTRSPIREVA